MAAGAGRVCGGGVAATIGQLLEGQGDLYDWVNRPLLSLAALKAAVEADICGGLAEGPMTGDQLAARAGVPADRLARIARFLAAEGVIDLLPDGRFAANARTRRLQELTAMILVQSRGSEVAPFLHESFQRGVSAYEARFGEPVFAHFAAQPRLAAAFAGMMEFLTRRVEEFVFTRHEFRPFDLAVDVGGSHGRLLLGLLARHGNARGILFDLPGTVAQVGDAVRASPAGDRVTLVGGDFFQSVPSGDLYLLKMILHDWDDEQCVAILRSVRAAMAPGGRVAVIEHVLPDQPTPSRAYFMDIAMMVWSTGRERHLAQFDALFTAAGLRRDRITYSEGGQSVIEAVAV